MEHVWHDEDVEDFGTGSFNDKPYIYVESQEDGEGDYPASLHFNMEDLEYMAARLGGALQSVKPNEVTTTFSREDIIMLAKTAKLTTEELD